MDQIDRRILTELQRDATLPIVELAQRVGLSASPCWKRVQKLERTGVIIGRVARVDPHKLGLGLTVLVEVTAMDHSAQWREAFLEAVRISPEVMEVLRLGGDSDYLLRVTVADTQGYDAFYRRFTAAVPLRAVRSSFVMETVHVKASLPLPEVA
jgi:Lrp/AsnC family transcriptional regulator